MKIKNLFISLFFILFIILNIIVGLYLIQPNSLNDISYFFILQIINIGVAYQIAEMFCSLIIKKINLKKFENLTNYPLVAFLYVTYNDASHDLMIKLKKQTYKHLDIFILDDSNKNEYRKITDNSGLNIIRRNSRKGFKAGSLNNWLSIHGNKYKYFAISDSDSCFENDFIENMVKYAEHPSNKYVAIFQSKILPWNKERSFPRILGAMMPLSIYFIEKLGNEGIVNVSWGHNNLHRVEPILKVGGFNEKFLAEDIILELNLLKKGYECKMVDVISYESIPENIHRYTKRSIRWAKQTLQMQKFNFDNVPFGLKLTIFMGLYNCLFYIVFTLGIFFAIFSHNSSLIDITRFLSFIIYDEHINAYLILFLFYLLNFTFLKLPLALKLGVPLRDYCRNLILHISIGNYMMFSILKGELKTILGQELYFEVTEKNRDFLKISLYQLIKEMRISVMFNIILTIGLIKNPIFLFFNFIWLIPFLLSPIIIYLTQNDDT